MNEREFMLLRRLTKMMFDDYIEQLENTLCNRCKEEQVSFMSNEMGINGNDFSRELCSKLKEYLQKRGYYVPPRVIEHNMRYQILKEQKWKCNNCGKRLKYKKANQYGEQVAHIDHIHPYCEHNTYPNGAENINERSNLQALCQDCNLKKSAKKN